MDHVQSFSPFFPAVITCSLFGFQVPKMESNTGFKLLQEAAGKLSLTLFSSSFALAMDTTDPLRQYRGEFAFPTDTATGKPYVYFCGNSLGLQHKDVEAAVLAETKKWREQAVEGHFRQPNPWFEIDDVLTEDMASIVGALPTEVAVMSSLTVNLHLLLSAFYQPREGKSKILCEVNPFPSDTHALVSQIRLHGFDPDTDFLDVAPDPKDGDVIDTQRFLDVIEEHHASIALVLIAGVHFLTGQCFDIATIAKAAHAKGIPIGVDLAHAVGNVPLALHDWGVDFACWCTYKYLNGGPGNIGGLFVHQAHTEGSTSAVGISPRTLHGWWGHSRSNRFRLGKEFEPSAGASRFQLSNPCVLSIMSLVPSVRLAAKIGMQNLRDKSLLLTGYLEILLTERLDHALQIVTPRQERSRGAQLSVRILPEKVKSKWSDSTHYENGTDVDSDAAVVQRQLCDLGIICDNRPPDFLRLAPVPTYNSFEDVYKLVQTLETLFVPKQ